MPASGHCTQLMNPKTDNELIGIYVDNDFQNQGNNAFNCLYERYRTKLFSYLLCLCSSTATDKHQVHRQATKVFDQTWHIIIDELRDSNSEIVIKAHKNTVNFANHLFNTAARNCPKNYKAVQRSACDCLQSVNSSSYTER